MPPSSDDAASVDLIETIDKQLEQVSTQSLDLSFNELMDMHRDGELNISPEYQRLFRWSEGARSRFVESLLLEMPVPPIYVIEEQTGKYLLIDGLQRISSYLHLRGELDAPHLDPPVRKGDKLALVDCDIVEGLNGRSGAHGIAAVALDGITTDPPIASSWRPRSRSGRRWSPRTGSSSAGRDISRGSTR